MIKFFTGIGMIFRKYFPKKQIKDEGGTYINGRELRTLLRNALEPKIDDNTDLFILDSEYYLPSRKYVEEIIAKDKINIRTYKPEAFDCDDFAYMLKATFIDITYKEGIRRAPFAFGFVAGLLPTPHAINLFVDDKKNVYFIEPQSDELIEVLNDNIKSIFSIIV